MTAESRRRSACLAASLAVAWNALPASANDVPPDTSTLYTRLDFYHSLAMARMVMWRAGTPDFIFELGQVPTGEIFRSIGLGSGFAAGDVFAFIGAGLGSGGGPDGSVTLSFSNPAMGVGRTFESLFPSMSEQAVASSILSGDSSLASFIDALGQVPGAKTPMSSDAANVHFSTGVFSGTSQASFTPIPEPGSAIVCLGALGIGCLVRRRAA